MSRCISYAFCGMLFLLPEVDSRLLATELTPAADAPLFATALTLHSPDSSSLETYRFELGGAKSDDVRYGEDEQSPLFTPQPETNPNASEWDYLWQNASRIPVTSIPEPTIGSLLIGGAILLCVRRIRKIK